MKDFLKDGKGQFSAMRGMSAIALLVGVMYTFQGGTFDILAIWLVAAFAPKAVQKFAER